MNLKPIVICLTVLLLPVIVSAQANRTWVAGAGDDVNSCSRSSPCKTFAGAIFKTNVGGEIDVIDPGGFGAVTITKSITIDAGRSFGSILSPTSVTGVIVNITAATDSAKTVRLRGFSINGLGTGTDGIRITSATQVFIEDVLIEGVGRHGVNIGASNVYVSIARSTIRNALKSGIHSEPSNEAPATLAVESTSVSTCEVGLSAGKGTIATVRNSAFLHNGTGVDARDCDVALVECIVAHGHLGVIARANSAIRISHTTVTRNETGLAAPTGGRIFSFKNNVVHGNGTDGAPTHTFGEV